jgi:hypothetical protein
VQPSSLSVPAQQSAEATVTMNVTPAEMRPWALAEREPAIEPDLLSEMEVDGFLKIDELGGDGQPKADGDRISVPFLSLPRRHACVASTTNEDFALGGIEDRVPQSWSNPCPEPGMARLYSQVATDPVDDQLPGAVDITGVGFRYEAIEPPPGETEPDTRLEWIIQTRGSRPTPQGVQFRVYLDVNMDGEFDWVVFNQYGPDLTLYMEDVDYPRGRWVVAHAPVFPGTLEPDYGQTEGLIFFQPYDLDETTSRLYAVAQELDIDMSSGVARFSFAVSAADASGDYDVVDGAPAIDRVPDDLADGGQLTYEQGRQACLAPWVDVPVPAGGDATVDLTSRCNAPPVGDVVPLRLLVSLPYNLPGSGQVQTRYGELKPLEPGPSPTPVVTGIPIYLPYGVRP